MQIIDAALLAQMQSNPSNFRVLHRVPWTTPDTTFPISLHAPAGDELQIALLDCETTGLDHNQHTIIELGLVLARYSPSLGGLTSIDQFVGFYNDPGHPIPPEITALTGITDEMVAGQHIDLPVLEALLEDDPIVVAHNAGFDRPFFDTLVSGRRGLNALRWACSIKGIDWHGHGYPRRALEDLLLRGNLFYEGHRATIDCLALAWLLHTCPAVLPELMAGIQAETVIIRAFGSPFAVKDDLKARAYQWDDGTRGANKHWWIEVPRSAMEEELEFLAGLYSNAVELAQITTITARNRFK